MLYSSKKVATSHTKECGRQSQQSASTNTADNKEFGRQSANTNSADNVSSDSAGDLESQTWKEVSGAESRVLFPSRKQW